MPKVPTHLVVFDIGGVLLRLVSGWEEACRIAGVGVPARLQDADTAEQLLRIVRAHEVGGLTLFEFCARTGALLDLSPRDVRAVSDAWLKGPYPGVAQVVERLHLRGAHTACLSNTNASHWRIITTCAQRGWPGIAGLSFRFASHMVGRVKPEADIYRHVQERTGFAAERIVFFDDGPSNIQAAQAQGWQAHRIDPAGDVAAQIAGHLRVHRLL